MSLNIDFNNIRSLGSQNEGFEELVCQLARRMHVQASKRFVRNGRPDGGSKSHGNPQRANEVLFTSGR